MVKVSRTSPSRRRLAFTIIELLIVIGIIAVLMGILLPMFSRVRELSRRTVCASNLRQLSAAAINYGVENHRMLPTGVRNGPPGDSYQHLPWVSDAIHKYLLSQVGDMVLSCPNIANRSDLGIGNGEFIFSYHQLPYGWVIGYNYLGGHTPAKWKSPWTSPVKASDDPSLPLFADFTFQSSGFSWAPHSWNGLVSGPAYTDPVTFGSTGSNVAYLNGSVVWVPATQQKKYSADTNSNYYANW